MCNLFFCKKSNRCKEWYLMIIIGKWILYWKAFLCLSMIYYILLQTSTGIISLKNTTTNRHIESANLIYIALAFATVLYCPILLFVRLIKIRERNLYKLAEVIHISLITNKNVAASDSLCKLHYRSFKVFETRYKSAKIWYLLLRFHTLSYHKSQWCMYLIWYNIINNRHEAFLWKSKAMLKVISRFWA